jgi:twitching motility two-component system response regulator PilG
MATVFNTIQVLEKFTHSDHSGCLRVDAQGVQWAIYFHRGGLQFVDCSVTTPKPLVDELTRYGWNHALESLAAMPSPAAPSKSKGRVGPTLAESMAWLETHHVLDSEQGQQLIHSLSRDALESCFWLQNAKTIWMENHPLPAWLFPGFERVSLDWRAMTTKFHRSVTGWHQWLPLLESPHQRPYLLDFRHIHSAVPGGTFSAQTLAQLAEWMRAGLSLRQLAMRLLMDDVQFAQLFAPYLQARVVHLRKPASPLDRLPKIPPASPNVPVIKPVESAEAMVKVVCVDPSEETLAQVQGILASKRYHVTSVQEAAQAAATVFEVRPDVIVLNAAMPGMNSYKFCNILRKSSAFRDTPIIMVTENAGVRERIQAKLTGATDCLMKPFEPLELVLSIEKSIPPP